MEGSGGNGWKVVEMVEEIGREKEEEEAREGEGGGR
jgi:hypothetical protein